MPDEHQGLPEERVLRCPAKPLKPGPFSVGFNLSPQGFTESSIILTTDFLSEKIP
jgi:hypothetical protein